MFYKFTKRMVPIMLISLSVSNPVLASMSDNEDRFEPMPGTGRSAEDQAAMDILARLNLDPTDSLIHAAKAFCAIAVQPTVEALHTWAAHPHPEQQRAILKVAALGLDPTNRNFLEAVSAFDEAGIFYPTADEITRWADQPADRADLLRRGE